MNRLFTSTILISLFFIPGCKTKLEQVNGTRHIKHPFILELLGDSFSFYQFGNEKFPKYQGKYYRLEETDKYVKVLGLTGQKEPNVIFFKIYLKHGLTDPWLKFSLDDINYTRNGWILLKQVAGLKNSGNKSDQKSVMPSQATLKILDDNGYNDTWKEVNVQREGDIETITFKPPLIMSDGMTEVIRIDHKNRKYWISYSGGVGGKSCIKGPYNIK